MKKIFPVTTILAVTLLSFVNCADAGQWRFPLGLTYVSGIGEVVDQIEDNLNADGYETEKTETFPVGASFQPYYEFDSGLGIGVGLGPLMVVFGDVDFVDMPVNVCLRYALFPEAKMSPYIRAGAAYHLANGDYVEGSQPGYVGAIGLEFMRDKPVGFGIEAGYDSSTIELEDLDSSSADDTKEFTPVGFMVSIFAVF
jgi:hypothetical protein